jgi:hypothetical protein
MEHYPRGTESVTLWCNICGRPTQHRVDDVRAGRCMEHEAPAESKKQIAARQRREKEARNPRLF